MFDSGETILVIGLGRSGLASTQVLRGRGSQVYAVDEKPPEQLTEAIAQIEGMGAVFVAPDALDALLSRRSTARYSRRACRSMGRSCVAYKMPTFPYTAKSSWRIACVRRRSLR